MLLRQNGPNKRLKCFSSPLHPILLPRCQDKQYPLPFPSTTKCRYIWTTIKTFFFFAKKSNRLSTKPLDHCSSQKSLVFKKKRWGGGNTVRSQQNENTNVPLSLVIPRLELQDQSVLECGATQHRAEKKKPCGLSRLWRCCGCR